MKDESFSSTPNNNDTDDSNVIMNDHINAAFIYSHINYVITIYDF